jgi:hypothetical protein
LRIDLRLRGELAIERVHGLERDACEFALVDKSTSLQTKHRNALGPSAADSSFVRRAVNSDAGLARRPFFGVDA